MDCNVAINSLAITLILQPACSDVKIRSICAHGNRLLDAGHLRRICGSRPLPH